MLCCFENLNPYWPSCHGSSVGRALAYTEQSVLGSRAAPLFSLKTRVVLGVVDLLAFPLYLTHSSQVDSHCLDNET